MSPFVVHCSPFVSGASLSATKEEPADLCLDVSPSLATSPTSVKNLEFAFQSGDPWVFLRWFKDGRWLKNLAQTQIRFRPTETDVHWSINAPGAEGCHCRKGVDRGWVAFESLRAEFLDICKGRPCPVEVLAFDAPSC